MAVVCDAGVEAASEFVLGFRGEGGCSLDDDDAVAVESVMNEIEIGV